jgi:hypothetical protein
LIELEYDEGMVMKWYVVKWLTEEYGDRDVVYKTVILRLSEPKANVAVDSGYDHGK